VIVGLSIEKLDKKSRVAHIAKMSFMLKVVKFIAVLNAPCGQE
jgi:hypothetical protein